MTFEELFVAFGKACAYMNAADETERLRGRIVELQTEAKVWEKHAKWLEERLIQREDEREVARLVAKEIRRQAREHFGMTTNALDELHSWLPK
jgi:hypothetical protein